MIAARPTQAYRTHEEELWPPDHLSYAQALCFCQDATAMMLKDIFWMVLNFLLEMAIALLQNSRGLSYDFAMWGLPSFPTTVTSNTTGPARPHDPSDRDT